MTPLLTGAEGDGEANLGVVVGWSPPVFTVGVELRAGAEALVAGAELVVVGAELLVELLVEAPEDPQPAATASATQAISVEAPRFIAARTLA